MAPQTRKSQAAANSAQEHAPEPPPAPVLPISLPDDFSTSSLDALLGPADWTAPTPELIFSVYQLILSQKESFDNALQEWEERLAQKDADIEQALQDHDTYRIECTEQLNNFQADVENLKNENARAEQERAELQARLATLSTTTSLSSHETDLLKRQIEERDRDKKALTDALDAALTRETRFQGENIELRTEAQTTRKQLSELQAKLAEVSSAEATSQFKVTTLEQHVSLLQSSNESMNNELTTQLNRYAELRRARTEEVSTLQSKLDQKTSDHDREAERSRHLQALQSDMERKLNEALERHRDLQSTESANARAFQDEMQACKELLAQYEKIADDAKGRVAEIEEEEAVIRRELAKREETLLNQTEREKERAEAAERKVEELEEVLQRVQTGELSMAETSFGRAQTPGSPAPGGMSGMSSMMLSPTASIVSKLQRGGRSITEVYAEYIRLQKEVQQERQEKARLETTLNDIFNEIQDRAPILTQQRLEYDRISAEARQLASQLSEALESRDQQARAAREANHTLSSKQKEIDLLNKQQIDLSRQVRGLLHQLARASDPSLPEEYVDEELNTMHANGNGVVDADAFVSSNLVLFRNLPQLQQQNQTLLKLTRSLASQLEERDRKAASEEESEMMTEARQLIENLQVQLRASQAKMEAYIKERDMFKAMASRRQTDGTSGAGGPSGVDDGPDYHRMYDEEHSMLESVRQETARDFESMRAELKQAKKESTELHVALGKSRATVEYYTERYKLIQSGTEAQAAELKSLSTRNNELEVFVRQAERKIGELSASLAEYSGNLAKAQSEVQLLKSEKSLQKSREDRLEHENRQLHAERARNSQTLEDYRRMKDDLSMLWEESKQSLEKEKTRLVNEVTSLREEVVNERTTARTKLTEKEAELRDLNHRLTQLNEEVIKSRETVAVSQANQSHLQTRSDDLNRQLHQAWEKLAVYERRPGSIGMVSMAADATEEEKLRAQVAELSAELKSVQIELTTERANGLKYQELAQTIEQAFEDHRKSMDEFAIKAREDLTTKESDMLSLQERFNSLQLEKQTLAEQKAALEADIETKEAQFSQEKKLLEDIVADIHGADQRALKAQQSSQQELLAEAQKAREAQQKYQAILVDHAAVLKERDSLQQNLQEAERAASRHLEDTKAAQSILADSRQSWEIQAQSLNQEVSDMRARYDDLSKQNDILHKQLASITAQAARLGEMSDTAFNALQEPSNDSQVQELQQVVQHVKREADLLRGQHELLKRENARINGDVRRLTAELELTRQRLSEEREFMSKNALAPNDQQTLLNKVAESAALIESNRSLRAEKASLEERLLKKSDELTAVQSELSPLKQEEQSLRSEVDFLKIENQTLQDSIDQWRKRATTVMTKFNRIDPEIHENLKSENEKLNGELTSLKTQLQRSVEQTARWKDAQQKWRDAFNNATEEAKERHNQLVGERDAVAAQAENATKELESARAEMQRLAEKNNESLASTTNAGLSAPGASEAATAEIASLNEQRSALQAENAMLKQELAVRANAPGDQSAELERSTQALKEAQQKLSDIQTRARGANAEMARLREKIATLEKALAERMEQTPTDPNVEAIIAQRLEAAAAQARAEKEQAVATATAALRKQLQEMSLNKPDVSQLQQQHAAEIKALQDQLASAGGGSAPTDAAIQQKVEQGISERLTALQAEHETALIKATENGRHEGEAKVKMMGMQLQKLRGELAQLKSQGAQARPAAAAASTSAAANAPPTPAQAPTTVKTETETANPIPASSVTTRGRGRGAPMRAIAPRGRGAAPGGGGGGRGTVLDVVNQALSTPAPPSPSSISILGASGQKRTREDEESADPGTLAKRIKPGEASLPPKPGGRGGIAIVRNRMPGTPGPS